MSAIDILIFVISIIGIFLEIKQKPIFWLTYIIASALLGYEFWQSGLIGSMFLQLCYIIMSVVGWYKWVDSPSGKKDQLSICHATLSQGLYYSFFCLVISGLLYKLFLFSNDHDAVADAILTSASLIATYMAIYKQIESWFVFAITAFIAVPLYLSYNLRFTALTYVIFAILDLNGGIKWLREYNMAYK